MDSSKIVGAIESVTAKWAKQRKQEERKASAVERRSYAWNRSWRVTIRDAAFDCMEDAYLKVSNNNTYPAHARQIMYAARGPIQEETEQPLDDQYFTQTLLPDYLLENPDTTKDWDVVFDARGHFEEPHTGRKVPLGTIDVRHYLRQQETTNGRSKRRLPYPTIGPANRFGAVLFIEKEGFLPLFRRAALAERYDIAIMSTKGVSVCAARKLVDELSGQGIPCLVLRDFDKAGFTIAKTLRTSGRRYTFQHRPRVIDLGLRLVDVQQNNLQSETVIYGKSNPRANLVQNGAAQEEIDYLCKQVSGNHYTGQRVELNAFTSADFLAWIEKKLAAHGVEKVIPDDEILAQAYREAYRDRLLRQGIRKLKAEIQSQIATVIPPPDLYDWVECELSKSPRLAWDETLSRRADEDIQQAQSPSSPPLDFTNPAS